MGEKTPTPVLLQSQPGDAHTSLQIPQELNHCGGSLKEDIVFGPTSPTNSGVGASDWLSPGHMAGHSLAAKEDGKVSVAYLGSSGGRWLYLASRPMVGRG